MIVLVAELLPDKAKWLSNGFDTGPLRKRSGKKSNMQVGQALNVFHGGGLLSCCVGGGLPMQEKFSPPSGPIFFPAFMSSLHEASMVRDFRRGCPPHRTLQSRERASLLRYKSRRKSLSFYFNAKLITVPVLSFDGCPLFPLRPGKKLKALRHLT